MRLLFLAKGWRACKDDLEADSYPQGIHPSWLLSVCLSRLHLGSRKAEPRQSSTDSLVGLRIGSQMQEGLGSLPSWPADAQALRPRPLRLRPHPGGAGPPRAPAAEGGGR